MSAQPTAQLDGSRGVGEAIDGGVQSTCGRDPRAFRRPELLALAAELLDEHPGERKESASTNAR
jgi:hypothetical protein